MCYYWLFLHRERGAAAAAAVLLEVKSVGQTLWRCSWLDQLNYLNPPWIRDPDRSHLGATYNGIPLPAGTAAANLTQTWGRGFGGFLVEGGLRPLRSVLIQIKRFLPVIFLAKACQIQFRNDIISFGWFPQTLTLSRYLQQILWKSIEHRFIREKLSNIVWNRDPVWRWKYSVHWQTGTKRRRCFPDLALQRVDHERKSATPESFRCTFSKQIEPQVKLYPGQELNGKVEGQEDRLRAKIGKRCPTKRINFWKSLKWPFLPHFPFPG